MSRLRRLENTEKIFYITYCLNRGQESFIEPGYQLLAQSIATARERRDFRLSAFVFMPDHWHALIRPRPGDSIGRILPTIKVTFTFRQKRSIDLTLRRLKLGWQPRFWDSFIRSVGVFHAKADYIHQNPVRRGLARQAEEGPWSSIHSCGAAGPVVLSVDHEALPLDSQARL